MNNPSFLWSSPSNNFQPPATTRSTSWIGDPCAAGYQFHARHLGNPVFLRGWRVRCDLLWWRFQFHGPHQRGGRACRPVQWRAVLSPTPKEAIQLPTAPPELASTEGDSFERWNMLRALRGVKHSEASIAKAVPNGDVLYGQRQL